MDAKLNQLFLFSASALLFLFTHSAQAQIVSGDADSDDISDYTTLKAATLSYKVRIHLTEGKEKSRGASRLEFERLQDGSKAEVYLPHPFPTLSTVRFADDKNVYFIAVCNHGAHNEKTFVLDPWKSNPMLTSRDSEAEAGLEMTAGNKALKIEYTERDKQKSLIWSPKTKK